MDSVEQHLLCFFTGSFIGVEVLMEVGDVLHHLLQCHMSCSLLVYELSDPFLRLMMVLKIKEIFCWFYVLVIKFFSGADLSSCDQFVVYCS